MQLLTNLFKDDNEGMDIRCTEVIIRKYRVVLRAVCRDELRC